jgi:transposase
VLIKSNTAVPVSFVRLGSCNELEHFELNALLTVLVAAGDNPQRLRNEATWAHLCGVTPIEASSGKITRHRLNRSGDRQANHALWRIALTRMSNDPRTRVYVERRIAEGKTTLEIVRILKRYIAREVYPLLPRT